MLTLVARGAKQKSGWGWRQQSVKSTEHFFFFSKRLCPLSELDPVDRTHHTPHTPPFVKVPPLSGLGVVLLAESNLREEVRSGLAEQGGGSDSPASIRNTWKTLCAWSRSRAVAEGTTSSILIPES